MALRGRSRSQLLAVGLFIERFYCRYLCPLGAALAIPGAAAHVRLAQALPRVRRSPCARSARNECMVQAIHPDRRTSIPNECLSVPALPGSLPARSEMPRMREKTGETASEKLAPHGRGGRNPNPATSEGPATIFVAKSGLTPARFNTHGELNMSQGRLTLDVSRIAQGSVGRNGGHRRRRRHRGSRRRYRRHTGERCSVAGPGHGRQPPSGPRRSRRILRLLVIRPVGRDCAYIGVPSMRELMRVPVFNRCSATGWGSDQRIEEDPHRRPSSGNQATTSERKCGHQTYLNGDLHHPHMSFIPTVPMMAAICS